MILRIVPNAVDFVRIATLEIPDIEFSRMKIMKFVVHSLLIAAAALLTGSVSFAAQDVDINVKFDRGQQHRVQMQFEHEGKVIMQKDAEREEEEFRKLPMKTIAKLGYHQRFTGKGGDIQAIRYYGQAKGQYSILKGETGASLTDNNRLVVVRVKPESDKRIQMASVANTLAQHELELLRNPLDPLAVASLVNKKDVCLLYTSPSPRDRG